MTFFSLVEARKRLLETAYNWTRMDLLEAEDLQAIRGQEESAADHQQQKKEFNFT